MPQRQQTLGEMTLKEFLVKAGVVREDTQAQLTNNPNDSEPLEKVNAIADWRTLIGPTDARKAKITHPDSVRAMCGEDLERSCVNGSDLRESAAREISFFFPHLLSGGTTLKHAEQLPNTTHLRVMEHLFISSQLADRQTAPRLILI